MLRKRSLCGSARTPAQQQQQAERRSLLPSVSPSIQSKRHIKRTKDNAGGIVSVESPLHYSNVALLDPVTNVPVRVVYRYTEEVSARRGCQVLRGSRGQRGG